MLTNKKYSGRRPLVVVMALLSLMIMLPLVGCKTDVNPNTPQQEQSSGENPGGSGKEDVESGKHQVTTYTVTFNSNGGSAVASQTVESGKTATKPEPNPTNPGFNFDGWYTSTDNGSTLADTAYNFDTPIVGDLKLYAVWNGRGSDGNIVLRNVSIPKTSEVQVISTAVDLSSLVVDGANSNVFLSGRSGTIQPFLMGQYEVTQQLYQAVMGKWGGTEPRDDKGKGDSYPAYYVSWYDAVMFCNKLSQLTGLEPAYSKDGQTDTTKWGAVPSASDASWDAIECDFTKNGYRLPTEAEFELSSRGGDPAAESWKYTYAGSNTVGDVAWYTANSGNKTHQVGTMLANTLNLYNMSGNLEEWCWDWTGTISADTLPSGGESTGKRVYRGGSFYGSGSSCAVSYRNFGYPYKRDFFTGFRVVRTAE